MEPFTRRFTCHRNNITGVVIHTGGHSQNQPGHIWGPGIRTYYLLHYVISGAGWYHVGKEQHQLSAGDLFLGYPNEIIKYGADLKNPWQYCWIGFSGFDIPHIIKATDFSRKNHVMHIECNLIPDTIIDIYNNYSPAISSYLLMLSKINTFFSILIENSHTNIFASKGNNYLIEALSFMETEYHETITIEDVAAYAGISSSHLYRLFINEYGIPPLRYLTQFRMRRACSMLVQKPVIPINVIAYSVGFNDPLYFTKVFQKTIGISPSEYRKNMI